MTLKAKINETDESSDDKDSKMGSYITRQFKKFMKNANVKSFDKDHKQSSSSHFSYPNIASFSTIVFVSPSDNVNSENNESKTEVTSENLDKGKSILGAPPNVEKKETRNSRSKKANNKKSQQKKLHFCHRYGVSGHTLPNCYKWLATQQSNSMVSSGNQNQFQSSLTPLGDPLKALMFLSNLNGFNSSPFPQDQRFAQRKCSSKVWKEKGLK